MTHRDQVAFRLYTVDDTPNSALARSNLMAFCRTHLPDRHLVEIIDVYREPMRALIDKIFMTPTLVIRSSSPERRIVGTLSEEQPLLAALSLEPAAG